MDEKVVLLIMNYIHFQSDYAPSNPRISLQNVPVF